MHRYWRYHCGRISICIQKMIIDGGMGTELTRCGAKQVNSHRLWSAIVNINQPEIVVEAHTNFINAGADIVISNSYKVPGSTKLIKRFVIFHL